MSEISIQKDHANLLWTGGWDSTFQLLQLLLIYKCSVSPFYLIHEDRPSTGIEIKTMKDIKNYIIKNYPHTKELFFPTQFHGVGDILPNNDITSAYHLILKKCHIGSQYEWLSRFCKERRIKDMHLSVRNPFKSKENNLDEIFNNMLIRDVVNSQSIYKLDPDNKNSNIFILFKYFVLPIRMFTKVQMNEIALSKGWKNIMDLTWFCQNPTYNEKPCGICTPCQQKINSGLEWRIPPARRALSLYYRRLFWPSKAVIRSTLIKLGLYSNKNDAL